MLHVSTIMMFCQLISLRSLILITLSGLLGVGTVILLQTISLGQVNLSKEQETVATSASRLDGPW